MSDMAGKAARVAGERSGSCRDTTPVSDIRNRISVLRVLRLPRHSLLSRRSAAKEDGEGGWFNPSEIRIVFVPRPDSLRS